MTLEARRVLVVEDAARIREILEFFLRRLGYIVECAPDGEVAAEMLRERGYDLVVTDFMMPKLTGVQLIKRMRESGDTTPVLLISGTVAAAALAAARRFGAVEVLAKPFAKDELIEKVEMLLAFQHGPGGDRAS
ncbi:MAG: response regulator [Planctomycetes bacterium]|nr:response regulator [Planctomycetota bacterium]